MSDLFSPPTKEELGHVQDLFAPPTQAEIGENNPSGFEVFLRDTVAPVGEFIDTYTGAPIRKGIGALQEGRGVLGAIGEAAGQFGENPRLAPTGKEIAQRAGIGEDSLSDVLPWIYNETGEGLALQKGGWADPTASGAAGLGIDLAADWTNLIPVGMAARAVAKGAKGALSASGKALSHAIPVVAKGADVLTGTELASKAVSGVKSGAEYVDNLARETADAIGKRFVPSVSKDYPDMVRKAKMLGLDESDLVESHKYGPRSFISRATRTQAEGPLGQQILEKHERGLQKLAGSIDSSIEGLGGGRAADVYGAGQTVRKDLENFKNQVFGADDISYERAGKYAPGLLMNREAMAGFASKIRGLEKHAKGLMRQGNLPEVVREGKAIMGYVNAAKKGLPSIDQVLDGSKRWSYKQFVENLQNLGKVAFPSKELKRTLPFKTDALRDLYFAGRDAVIGTVERDISPEFAEELVNNNSRWAEFLKNEQALPDFEALAPEKFLGSAFSDTSRIESLKKILSPEGYNRAAAAWAKSRVPRTAEGNVSFRRLKNELNADRALFERALGPELTAKLEAASDLGVAFADPKMSTSGTSAAEAFRATSAPNKLLEMVTNQSVTDRLKAIADKRAATPPPTGGIPSRPIPGFNPEVVHRYMELKPDRFLGLRGSPAATGANAIRAYSIHDTGSRRVGPPTSEQNGEKESAWIQSNQFIPEEERKQLYLESN